ncbi:hypothetical protein [uncultured Pseudoteredinibacter sp.]|uniref:hypothetical protein n=1 Tax=uncultured Pseudoteredinibacter sp. TaxID=1641701 RepID=UPI002602631D|nr:hypothetical protein [uncultured Pseudoteredinibacter sp.]
MDTEKKRRLAKFKRKRKELRITNHTQHWLNALSAYYETTETAIIEAAVMSFGERYITDAMAEVKDKGAGQNRPFIEEAKKYEKLPKTSNEGILYV